MKYYNYRSNQLNGIDGLAFGQWVGIDPTDHYPGLLHVDPILRSCLSISAANSAANPM
jgi:hypothetical protein